jgi:DnaA family protein
VLFSPQMPLPLEPRRDRRFEDFVAGPNLAVVEALRQLSAEPAVCVYLQGPESSGKTHLLTAACHAARDAGRTAFYAGLRRMPGEAAASLDGLEGLDLVCVDDLEAVAGDWVWEEALFHLFNRLREAGGKLLVASRLRLSALPLGLPDLRSRLASGVRLNLQPLDESDQRELLARHASSLGLVLPEEVSRYLLSRGHRSLAWLLGAVEALQAAAFAAKRRATVPLAREVLRGLERER